MASPVLAESKLPPSSVDAEQAVCGACLVDRSAITRVRDILRPDDFFRDSHRAVYEAICALEDRGWPADIVSLADELERQEQLRNPVGGLAYLHSLATSVPTAIHAEHYAEIVRRTSIKRRLIAMAGRIGALGYDDRLDVDDAIAQAEDAFVALQTRARSRMSGVFTLDDVEAEVEDLYENGWLPGLATCWPELNSHYRVVPGEFTVVGGIPGNGKSSWLDALLMDFARRHNWRFLISSPENPTAKHIAKLTELYCDKPFSKLTINRGAFDEAKVFIKAHFRWVLPYEGHRNIKSVLNTMATSMAGEQFQGLVLDPWNNFEHDHAPEITETKYISAELTRIKNFAGKHAMHAWIVAHPTAGKLRKKPDGTYPVPTAYDISDCYDDQTEVLTTVGWKPHADVTLDDLVACFDLDSETIAYQQPVRLIRQYYSGPMVRLKGPSIDALVTPNHRLVVKPAWGTYHEPIGSGLGRPFKYERGPWCFIAAGEARGSLVMPLAAPLATRSHGYAVTDDELRIWGWWIAEGWVSMGAIALCQAEGELSREMSATITRLGLKFTERVTNWDKSEKPMWAGRVSRRSHASWCDWMISQCGEKAAGKKLPEVTWQLSMAQKWVLLEALIQGDGWRPPARPGTASYTTTSRQLANDIQRLCVEMGLPVALSEHDAANPRHARQFILHIGRAARRTISLRYGRHFSTEQYDGTIYCLEVPTGAYVTRRCGRVGFYGNSSHWFNKSDNVVTIWRNVKKNDDLVEIHVQKVRFKQNGTPGMATLRWDHKSGNFYSLEETL